MGSHRRTAAPLTKTAKASPSSHQRWGAQASRLVLASARIERAVNRALHDWHDADRPPLRGPSTLVGKLGALLERVETLPVPEAYRRDLRLVLRQASAMADYLYRICQQPLARIVGDASPGALATDELLKLEAYARQAESVATRLSPLASLVNQFRADGVERELATGGRPQAACQNPESWLQAA